MKRLKYWMSVLPRDCRAEGRARLPLLMALLVGVLVATCFIVYTQGKAAQNRRRGGLILAEVAKRYEELDNLQCQGNIRIRLKADGIDDLTSLSMKLVFQKPNRLHLEATDIWLKVPSERAFISDGKNLWIVNRTFKEYGKLGAPQNLVAMRNTLVDLYAPFNLMLELLLLAGEQEPAIGEAAEVELVGMGRVGGVDTYVLEINYAKMEKVKLTVCVGKKDYLVYRMWVDIKAPEGHITMEESYRDIKVNERIAESVFTFKAPKGYKSWEELGEPRRERMREMQERMKSYYEQIPGGK